MLLKYFSRGLWARQDWEKIGMYARKREEERAKALPSSLSEGCMD